MTEIKNISIRWPKKLWLALTNKAFKEETSIQTLITEAVLDKYGIEGWRTGTKKQVDDILKQYNYIPIDIQEAIDEAMLMKGRVSMNLDNMILEDI